MDHGLSELRATLARDVHEGAITLLGCRLRKGELEAQIVEVEAYHEREPGCHAFTGQTPRNAPLYGPPGTAYVYLSYGVHWLLNVVCESEGVAAAVLIRAAIPTHGIEAMRSRRPAATSTEQLLRGPGCLGQAFALDGSENGQDMLDPGGSLHLLPGPPPPEIVSGTRIGLSPGKGDELPWRYFDLGQRKFVSSHRRWTARVE